MKLWVVFIRQTGPVGEHLCHWIDSQWADFSHAQSRTVEVRDSMKACSTTRHEVFYTQTTVVADTKIVAERSHRKKPEVKP